MACFPSLPSLCKRSPTSELSSAATLPSLGLSPWPLLPPGSNEKGSWKPERGPALVLGCSHLLISHICLHIHSNGTDMVFHTHGHPVSVDPTLMIRHTGTHSLSLDIHPTFFFHAAALHSHSALSPTHAHRFILLLFHPLCSRSFFP